MRHFFILSTYSEGEHTTAQRATDVSRGVLSFGKAMLCIESFNLFCDRPSAPCYWAKSVYNKANGGVLDEPSDFFSSDLAASFFKMRLGYIVARYGGSPAVFAWEFFNGTLTAHALSSLGEGRSFRALLMSIRALWRDCRGGYYGWILSG